MLKREKKQKENLLRLFAVDQNRTGTKRLQRAKNISRLQCRFRFSPLLVGHRNSLDSRLELERNVPLVEEFFWLVSTDVSLQYQPTLKDKM